MIWFTVFVAVKHSLGNRFSRSIFLDIFRKLIRTQQYFQHLQMWIGYHKTPRRALLQCEGLGSILHSFSWLQPVHSFSKIRIKEIKIYLPYILAYKPTLKLKTNLPN